MPTDPAATRLTRRRLLCAGTALALAAAGAGLYVAVPAVRTVGWADVRVIEERETRYSDLILELFGPDVGAHVRSSIGTVIPLNAQVNCEEEVEIHDWRSSARKQRVPDRRGKGLIASIAFTGGSTRRSGTACAPDV